MSSKDEQHRFKKDRDGLEIESVDPIQDIMDDEELAEAEATIEKLIEQQNQDS